MIKQYLAAGLSVIPITKGTKSPLIKWDVFQVRQATQEEAAAWTPPIGIVGGKVSGGLVCIDFDDKGSRFNDWINLVQTTDPLLALSLVVQQTPSGGFHVVYRCPEAVIGNEKLARKPLPGPDGKMDLIETRGEGGQFLAYPSEGYQVIQNDFLHIPTISLENHNFLIDCAKSFDEKAKEKEKDTPTRTSPDFDVSPFDDYDAKNTPVDLLCSHGWELVQERGETVYLKRPNKQERGISASWNHVPNRFYVFTTNTQFENEHIYKASAVYAILEHDGNWSAAAKALLEKGFGTRKKRDDGEAEFGVVGDLSVLRVRDFMPDILRLKREGMPTGYSTGFRTLDKYYRVAKGQLNVVTGIPSSGKSEIMDAIMVNMARNDGFRFVVFSPENYPLEIHVRKLSEKYIDKHAGSFSEEEFNRALDFVDKHFFFIPATDESVNIFNLICTVEKVLKTEKIDGLLIDPFNEIEGERLENMTETEYIGKALSVLRKFSRRNKIATWIVAHPTKLRKEKNPDTDRWEYPVPDLYSISGSANWYNKADNGIVVWRDFENNFSKIIIQKIKFKYYGGLGEIRINYNPASGNYAEGEGDGFDLPDMQGR